MIVQQFLRWIETAPPHLRAEATHALARAYLYSKIDDETRSGMEAAMTVLLDDPAGEVRFSLADALGSHADAPRHVILALAADQPDIAEIVLTRSPVFVQSELVEFIRSGSERMQFAIAGRPWVSAAVSAALGSKGERVACERLLFNPGADIDRFTMRKLAERFGEEPAMRDLMLEREDLPPEVRQALVRQLCDRLGDLVTGKNWLSEDRARNLVREASDREVVAIVAEAGVDDLPMLVDHLRESGQLTTALILRVLCTGHIQFFEAALSALSGTPLRRVEGLVRGGRTKALQAIYAKAGIPAGAFDAFTAALRAYSESEPGDEERENSYQLTARMTQSVLARYGEMADGEADDLVRTLRRFATDMARDAARDYARMATAA